MFGPNLRVVALDAALKIEAPEGGRHEDVLAAAQDIYAWLRGDAAWVRDKPAAKPGLAAVIKAELPARVEQIVRDQTARGRIR